MVIDTVSEDVKQVARRLSQTRKFSLDSNYKRKMNNNKNTPSAIDNSNTLKKVTSQPSAFHQIPYFSYGVQLSTYPDKIKTWMSQSIKMLAICDSEDNNTECRDKTRLGHQLLDESRDEKEIPLPNRLRKYLSSSTSSIYDAPWDVTKCDLFLEVEKTLFPVEKNFICYISKTFHNLIKQSPEIQLDASVALKLDEYTLDEMTTVITFMYSAGEQDITDQNVASCLQLGDEFKVSRLIYRSEKYLRKSKTFNPFIMAHLAKQYHLMSLLEYAYCEISKIQDVDETQEFQRLDESSQNQIMRFMLMRYKNATKTLSQFDVHLCQHHGEDHKNNNCCFRAATYSTENNRTYLVRMENPEEKIIKKLNKALSSSSETLLEEREKGSMSSL